MAWPATNASGCGGALPTLLRTLTLAARGHQRLPPEVSPEEELSVHRRSSVFATRSWPAGSSTCPSAAGSSSASTTATRCARGTSRGARWRSAPGSARTSATRSSAARSTTRSSYCEELADSLGATLPERHDDRRRLPDSGSRSTTGSSTECSRSTSSSISRTSRRRSTRSRACSRPDGRFVAVIPAKGAGSTSLARRFTSKRLFEREFGRDYDWFIRSEHINLPWEIERRAREAVPRRRGPLLPVSDPVGQRQPDHRAHDAPAHLRLTPTTGRGRPGRCGAGCRRPSRGDRRRARAAPPTDPTAR